MDQLALARLISSGRYDRHLRRMRVTYATRRAALVDALAAHAPGLPLTGLAAGFHAVAHVDHANEGELIGAALARSVGLYGMSQWRADHADTPTRLVLGFGNTTDRAITEGCTRPIIGRAAPVRPPPARRSPRPRARRARQ